MIAGRTGIVARVSEPCEIGSIFIVFKKLAAFSEFANSGGMMSDKGTQVPGTATKGTSSEGNIPFL